MKKFCYLLMMFFLCSTSTTFASEWKENDFDFSSLRTILVIVNVDNSEKYRDDQFKKILSEQIFGAKEMNLLFMTEVELDEAMGRITTQDISQLKQNHPEEYQKTLTTILPFRVDGILTITISNFSSSEVYHPAQTYSYTTYTQQVQYTSSYNPTYGMMSTPTVVQIPQYHTGTTPAYYSTSYYSSTKLELTTSQNKQTVWYFLDTTSAETPMATVEKNLKKGIKSLQKITGKSKSFSPEPLDSSFLQINYFTPKVVKEIEN